MAAVHIPCYVINLRADIAKRNRMKAALAGHTINPIFFDAIDGRSLSEADLDRHLSRQLLTQEYGVMSPGEVGRALSHLAIYRDIVQRGLDMAVILEDDVCIADEFGELLDTSSSFGLSGVLSNVHPEMLQLTRVSRGYRFTAKQLLSDRAAIRPAGSVWLASGYMINQAGARSLSKSLYPIWTVADHWSRFQEKGLIRLWSVTSPVVWEPEQARVSRPAAARMPREGQEKTIFQRVCRVGHGIMHPVLTRSL
ncbi:glycosyltransferase family 25 protein [Pollutimonas bauzanensis]|jgi:glycosyl transferase family 25|uniref:glycosyltransferase family 25 protein n=1 Tax=Pollutimonas bauzanensis TaxID=658167 RepID=UPI00333ECD27